MTSQCVLLTSSGVCLVDATVTMSSINEKTSLDSDPFCRLVACLLQLSHGPENGEVSTKRGVSDATATTTDCHRLASMFVLENRQIHLLEDLNLGLAGACWVDGNNSSNKISSVSSPSSSEERQDLKEKETAAVPTFLHQVFHTFIAAHPAELVQEKINTANAKLDDLCLSYSIQTVVKDSTITATTSAAAEGAPTIGAGGGTVDVFQKFKDEWLSPSLASLLQRSGVVVVPSLSPAPETLVVPRPPSDPKPLGGTRPLTNKVDVVDVEAAQQADVVKNSRAAVGSGASAAAALVAGER